MNLSANINKLEKANVCAAYVRIIVYKKLCASSHVAVNDVTVPNSFAP